MNSKDLSAGQLAVIRDRVHEQLGCIDKLQKRMQQCGFSADDPLQVHVGAICDAQRALLNELQQLAQGVQLVRYPQTGPEITDGPHGGI